MWKGWNWNSFFQVLVVVAVLVLLGALLVSCLGAARREAQKRDCT